MDMIQLPSSNSHGSGESEQPRKLAVLGLPWETSEDTLRIYFSHFGVLEQAEVMKDRYTGKSRGFGFVTFVDPVAAQHALASEHTIDGRRCEAKIALPKGETAAARTTRIFVARIPQAVPESQFRAYFEKFGKLQDAYMPKDHSKQGYRGIGFVTFASPDAVEKVMACKHWINGQEIAIDRATPKDDVAIHSMFKKLSGFQSRRSYDNGSGIVGSGFNSALAMNHGLTKISASNIDSFGTVRSLSEDRDLTSMMSRGSLDAVDFRHAAAYGRNSYSEGEGVRHGHMRAAFGNFGALGSHGSANTAALHEFAKAQAAALHASGVGMNVSSVPGNSGIPGIGPDLSGALMSGANANTPLMHQMQSMHPALLAAATAVGAAAGGAKRPEPNMLKRPENPVIANARAGPRIFIGKLTKDTSEADVKEYFMKFGYVMDVYMPKAKDNKMEHRGFGFVTFETDAAIQRVVAAGTHRLKGSTIAIDIAMPKMDEDGADGQMDNLQMGLQYVAPTRL